MYTPTPTQPGEGASVVNMEVAGLVATYEGERSSDPFRPYDMILGSYGGSVRVRVDGHIYRINEKVIVDAVRAAHHDRLKQQQIRPTAT